MLYSSRILNGDYALPGLQTAMNCTTASRRFLVPARNFCRAAFKPQATQSASCPRSGSRGLLTGRRALVRPRQAAITQHLLPEGGQSVFGEGIKRGLATETAPESAFASEHDYHVLADETLDRVMEVVEQLEDHLDDFEPNLSVRPRSPHIMAHAVAVTLDILFQPCYSLIPSSHDASCPSGPSAARRAEPAAGGEGDVGAQQAGPQHADLVVLTHQVSPNHNSLDLFSYRPHAGKCGRRLYHSLWCPSKGLFIDW